MSIDVAAYQPPAVIGGLYIGALFTPMTTGRTITGTEKLVQRFLLEFMTELGSQAFAPKRGCEFLSLLHQGLLSEVDVSSIFDRAMITLTNNLQSEELPTDPLNERFAAAQVVKVAIKSNELAMQVQVYAKDGQTGILAFPINLRLDTIAVTTID